MRVLAALAVLLLVAICSLAEADLQASRNAPLSKEKETQSICCFKYTSWPIPRRIVHSAYRTSSSCPVQAVILVTRKGRKICVDPKARWVQQYLEHLELPEY